MGIETARRVRAQEVEQRAAEGPPVLRRGVARERLVSVEDPQMRHGRKSRSVRFSRYKRHVLRDLDTGLLRAVGDAGQRSEASVAGSIAEDLSRQPDGELGELHIDRAYLSSDLVRERPPELKVYCKAWRAATASASKTEFALDWQRGLRCAVRRVRLWRLRLAGLCASRRRRAPRAPYENAVGKAGAAAGA